MEVTTPFSRMLILALLLGSLAFAVATAPSASATRPPNNTELTAGVLKGNPSDKRLATEFLRLLKNKDKAGLRNFLDPAFLLQRGDGSYLTKRQYLKDPAIVDAFRVRNIVATRNSNVRVLRFEAKTDQIVNGTQVPGVWIPRLSTFIKKNKVWRLISHANFLPPKQ